MMRAFQVDPSKLHCAMCNASGFDANGPRTEAVVFFLFTNVLSGRTELVCDTCVDEDEIPKHLVYDETAKQPSGAG